MIETGDCGAGALVRALRGGGVGTQTSPTNDAVDGGVQIIGRDGPAFIANEQHAHYTRGRRPRHAPTDARPRTTERAVGDARVASGVAAAVARSPGHPPDHSGG